MRLQLADGNCKGCAPAPALLPVRDPETGRIYNVNPMAFAQMSPAEQMQARKEAPIILARMVEREGLGEGIDTSGAPFGMRQALQQINRFSAEQQKLMQQGKLTTPVSYGYGAPTSGLPNNQIAPNWSVAVEPSAKPWFARTEVLVPVLIGGAFVTYVMFQRPQRSKRK